MKVLFTLVLTLFFCSLFAQSDGDYRSRQTGNWNTVTTWEVFNSAWVNLEDGSAGPYQNIIPSNSSGEITISANNTVSLASGSIDVNQLIIAANNSAILDINAGATLDLRDGVGDDLTILTTGLGGSIAGELRVNGTFFVSDGATIINASTNRMFVNNGGVYQHGYKATAGVIYPATWRDGSALEFVGYTTNETVPTGLNQSFYNIIWNCTNKASGSGFYDFDGALGDATIRNNLIISATSDEYLLFTQATPYTLNIGNDFIVQNNSAIAFNGLTSGTNSEVNIVGNFEYNSTASLDSWLSIDGDLLLDIGGDFNIIGGTIDIINDAGSPGTSTAAVNLSGDLSVTVGASLTNSVNNADFTFDGISQSVNNDGTITGNINYSVLSGATLTLGTSIISGSGSFTTNAGSTLQLGSIDPAGALQNNIQVSGTQTYNSGSTIVYNGSAAQFIGTAHPPAPAVIIDNPVSVTLAADASMANLSFTSSGNLVVDGNQLTLTGSLTPNGQNIEVDAGSDIVITGTAAFGTFPFIEAPQTLNNFTFDRTGRTVTFATDVAINGELGLLNGTLNFDSQTLTLDGTISGTGFLSSNSGSDLNITGTGTLGNLTFNVGNNTLNSLTIERTNSGMVSLTGTLNIANALILTEGEFDNNTGTIAMADGATITRDANGSLTGNSPEVNAPATYNVIYLGGGQTTGAEIPTAVDSDALGDLTINTSGEVILAHDLTVNGISTLQSGSLGIGANTLTVKGNWVRNNGSLSSYTEFVVFDGNSTISSGGTPPTFGNIQATAGSTLTLPSGNINFTGDIQIDVGANFNANSGTAVLNGTVDQQINSAGADFNNITVNKSSGIVELATQMDLLGSLSFTSSTTFQSNGNLTVISSSDGTSGNGRIGSLAGGASVTGEVIVQRYMSGEGRLWRYLSSPVQDAVVDDWKDDFPITGDFIGHSTQAQWPGTPGIDETATSLYYYDESVDDTNKQVGYVAYPSTGAQSSNSPLVPGKGYSAYIREAEDATVVDVKGVINNGKTPLSIPVTYQFTGNDEADGWNLIGNPFPSSINWNSSSVNRSGVGQGISITDNASGIFQDWNGESGTLPNGNVATAQGFWVKATSADPSITIGENAKVSTTSTFYKTNENVENQLILSLSDGKITDKAFAVINSESTGSYDPEYDIYNLNNYSDKEVFDIATFDIDSNAMAINYFPEFGCTRILRVEVKDTKKGQYTLGFEGLDTFTEGTEILLHDNFTNSSINISEQSEYNFTVTNSKASYGSNRFYLEFQRDDYLASSLDLKYDNALCASENAKIEINNPQASASYYLLKNDAVVSDTLASVEGAGIAFNIAAGLLNNGENEFKVAALGSGCDPKLLEQPIVVSTVNIEPEIALNKGLLISNYEEGNQWFFNDEIIDGATESTYRPEESGTYTLNVSKGDCSENTSLEYVITSIDLESRLGFAVYPNPAVENLNIQWEDSLLGDKKMTIYNSEGRKIYSTQLGGEVNSFKINILSWPRGVYLLKLTAGGNILTQRIIKQ